MNTLRQPTKIALALLVAIVLIIALRGIVVAIRKTGHDVLQAITVAGEKRSEEVDKASGEIDQPQQRFVPLPRYGRNIPDVIRANQVRGTSPSRKIPASSVLH